MRLINLDILRAFAILLVIAVHSMQAFPTAIAAINQVGYLGRFGVQLFFLVSAFTMCLMWDARVNERDRFYKFYMRRFLRIAPLYLMFIPIYIFLFGTGATYWLPNGIEAKHIITNLTLTHSFWPDTIGGIVHGGWSISVEAMFYLLFPLLAVVALHRSAAFSAALAALSFSIISFAYQPIFELYS